MRLIHTLDKLFQLVGRYRAAWLSIAVFFLMTGYMNCGGFNIQDQTLYSTFPPKSISMKVRRYCPPSGGVLKQYFVTNLSSVITAEGFFQPDTDRDGLSDGFEKESENQDAYRVGPDAKDTNSDGYNDFVVVKAGYKTDSQASLTPCPEGDSVDLDRDGLNDCAEELIGSKPDMIDSDGDLIPDALEWRFGLNPHYTNDAAFDPDVDNASNLEEIKLNAPRFFSNNLLVLPYPPLFLYNLAITQKTTFGSCYELEVKNIPIMNVINGNEIQVIFMEDRAGSKTMQRMSAVIRSEVKNDTTVEFDFADGQVIRLDDVPVDQILEGDQR